MNTTNGLLTQPPFSFIDTHSLIHTFIHSFIIYRDRSFLPTNIINNNNNNFSTLQYFYQVGFIFHPSSPWWSYFTIRSGTFGIDPTCIAIRVTTATATKDTTAICIHDIQQQRQQQQQQGGRHNVDDE